MGGWMGYDMNGNRGRPHGVSIRIFLVDGVPQGPRLTDKSGWTGSCFDFSRADYGRVRQREELGRSGVYVLVGPEESDVGRGERVYVGEADVVRARLDEHQKGRDFWTRAYVLTNRTEELNKAHVRYLEARFIRLARSARLVTLENATEPDARGLSEADAADMESYLDEALLLLPLVGVNAFAPVEAPAARSTSRTPEGVASAPVNSAAAGQGDEPTRYFLREKLVTAEALDAPRGFTVLEGSLGRAETKVMLPGYQRLREQLLADALLAPEGHQQLRLIRAYAFPSPSAAAAVLTGGSRNGRNVWKDSGGRSLGDRQSDTTR